MQLDHRMLYRRAVEAVVALKDGDGDEKPPIEKGRLIALIVVGVVGIVLQLLVSTQTRMR